MSLFVAEVNRYSGNKKSAAIAGSALVGGSTPHTLMREVGKVDFDSHIAEGVEYQEYRHKEENEHRFPAILFPLSPFFLLVNILD